MCKVYFAAFVNINLPYRYLAKLRFDTNNKSNSLPTSSLDIKMYEA